MTSDTETLPAAGTETHGGAPPHPLRELWRYFSANAGAVAGLAIIVAVMLLAAFADIVAPHAPNVTHDNAFLRPPFWEDGGSLEYPLRTDAIGRDLLSRPVNDRRLSLLIGVIVVTLSLSAGIVLGLVAGFFRGLVEIA